jgi:hypothetical protein
MRLQVYCPVLRLLRPQPRRRHHQRCLRPQRQAHPEPIRQLGRQHTSVHSERAASPGRWKSGSCFQVVEVPSEADDSPADIENQIRKQEEKHAKKELRSNNDLLPDSKNGSGAVTPSGQPHMRYTHKHFKWAPQFKDVYESVENSEPGNDGWAVAQGFTSVTPLRANFMHVTADKFQGEITL